VMAQATPALANSQLRSSRQTQLLSLRTLRQSK
jgi:hypothetical protein